ncbi:ZPR1-type zinc finger-containing protein [Cavenderia fasciculata]|uniref:ZPR1-type zinc finger-containing protein n=1 Tax=Cavenderia fasciculata TaxID=261658 RepID=F4Q5W3_CACFS|nr:ZPR1-type zinc finger-containing protein [Cavenderia fasciculata]EGG17372.1 ZPR1-type zinc finger-containing protein [Cavenderia fasciculata]|eukprot:XP_004355856.1 ZPR1-type zinc finger-containing protein [Cavenderia fasciculata]
MSDNNNKEEDIQAGDEFKDLSHTTGVQIIESLCMNCHEDGITKILLTKIPFFKEIILLSFECEHCGFKSSEVQSGGAIGDKGVHIEFNITKPQDLNRQLVKMDTATIRIPSLDFEIPSSTQKGSLNTIEGFLNQSVVGLNQAADIRKEDGDEETYNSLRAFIERLERVIRVEEPFKLIVDDPSGNSYIENPMAPKQDPALTVTHYIRNAQQNLDLGITRPEDAINNPTASVPSSSSGIVVDNKQVPSSLRRDGDNNTMDSEEIMELPQSCVFCGEMGAIKMVMTDIPYFKNVVLMAFSCENCGYKSNEIKPGGAIEPFGKRLTLRVESIEDLSRDVLKSETANAVLPELEVEITHGSLGGRFTTIEGLLKTIKEELEKNPFFRGDSADATTRARYEEITTTLEKYIAGEKPFTIEIDDPIANSYIQSLYAPDPDPNLDCVIYERTFDQNEELGLNDINTKDFETLNVEDDKSNVD